MKKLSFIFALAVMAITWTSCDKDKDDVKPNTKKDLLTAHPWKLTSARIDPPITVETPDTTVVISDLYDWDECLQKFAITFSSANTYTSDGGDCSEDELIITNGTWQFNESETSITIDPSDDVAETAKIEKLTDSNFEISQDWDIEEDDFEWSGKIILSFKK